MERTVVLQVHEDVLVAVTPEVRVMFGVLWL
jgi:hypothetical protein